jgi:hypothetical protein
MPTKMPTKMPDCRITKMRLPVHMNSKSCEAYEYRLKLSAQHVELIFGLPRLPRMDYRDPELVDVLEHPPPIKDPPIKDEAFCGIKDPLCFESEDKQICTRFRDLHFVHYNHLAKRAWKLDELE